MFQALVFIFVTSIVAYFSIPKYRDIARAISLGRMAPVNGSVGQRWKNMALFALGQKKMFSRPIAGIFHLFIYVAFLFTQLEAIEIFIDGISGGHRFFAGKIGVLYPLLINLVEGLSALALVATAVFLIRRNILKVRRFHKPELTGWPFRDANIILFGEIVLVISILMMNGAYQALSLTLPDIYPDGGKFFLSAWLTQPAFETHLTSYAGMCERMFWWLHYLVILGFVAYLPHSKHLHIFLAFPASYYGNQHARGKMEKISGVEREVREMLGMDPGSSSDAEPQFGASDIHHLDRITLLQAFSCTECGRCTAECPANQTGKRLSPRKIIMEIRDRCEEVVKNSSYQRKENGEMEIADGKSLFDRISREEIYACTTCNACVEACPVLINPLQTILEMRRWDILMQGAGPASWNSLFNSLENSQAAWSMSGTRTDWMQTN
ncbi:MAG: (Fe-S)-binding protein [Saprospiraceae bacterium]|nr:(Fe-S)-binding protein [Saprospiraceae bacterium]